jgi:D-glycero-D-manno-heptose 1,7-bisphosphate phosphatase
MGIDALDRRAVFLDRDGVINQALVRDGKPYPPRGLDELVILPGVVQACRDLHQAGFLIIMVTNQPDVARGSQNQEAVEAINHELTRQLFLDDVRVCFHDDADLCACRKPKPGLIMDAARDWAIRLGDSYMVGDRWRDIEAGRRAGCKTIFLDYGYQEKRPAELDYLTISLTEAVKWILRPSESERMTSNGNAERFDD